MTSPVHMQHRTDRCSVINGPDDQVIHDNRTPVATNFLAQLQLIVFEQRAIRSPTGRHNLGAEKTGRWVHLDNAVLDTVRIAIDDELIRYVFQYGVGTQTQRGMLTGRLFSGLIDLGGRLSS